MLASNIGLTNRKKEYLYYFRTEESNGDGYIWSFVNLNQSKTWFEKP